MKLTSIAAIYFLFWVMSAMLVLPFGVRTHQEEGVAMIPGQATSAPVKFEPRKVARRATVLSMLLFGLYYLNYVQGWVTLKDIDITTYL
jgi:predicted secreted protein